MQRWRRYRLLRHIFVSSLLFLAILSCGKSQKAPVSQDAQELGLAEYAESLPGKSEGLFSTPVSTQNTSTEEAISSPATHGVIMLGGELELTVTGKGAGDLSRAPAVLEQQLLSFLPQLRESYDHQLARDPHGMGSLDVRMTIEPDGTISALRFPVKRISSETLTTAMYDIMRAWQFLPAEHAVDLRYRMILIPSGMDRASISRWETSLADRSEIDRSEKISPTVAAVLAGKTPAEDERTQERSPQPGAGSAEAVRDTRSVAQWYRVTRRTTLHEAPGSTAPAVTRLPAGKRVWVIGIVAGEWLEIRSVKGRRPGFLPRQDAKLEQRERARR